MKQKSGNTCSSINSCIGIFLFVIFCCLYSDVFSQETLDTAFTYTFKVRDPKTQITVEEKDSVMYTDFDNHLCIRVEGKNKLGPVVLEGGSILRNGNDFIAKLKEGGTCVLAVYVIKPNGKITLGLSKTYPIIRLADPIPFVGGVKPDSIIPKHALLEANSVYATLTRFNKTSLVKVLSFEMQVFMDTATVNYKSVGDHFSPEMRRYIQILKPGVPLNFRQIICLMPNGQPRKLRDMRLFVDCTPRCVSAKE